MIIVGKVNIQTKSLEISNEIQEIIETIEEKQDQNQEEEGKLGQELQKSQVENRKINEISRLMEIPSYRINTYESHL